MPRLTLREFEDLNYRPEEDAEEDHRSEEEQEAYREYRESLAAREFEYEENERMSFEQDGDPSTRWRNLFDVDSLRS